MHDVTPPRTMSFGIPTVLCKQQTKLYVVPANNVTFFLLNKQMEIEAAAGVEKKVNIFCLED